MPCEHLPAPCQQILLHSSPADQHRSTKTTWRRSEVETQAMSLVRRHHQLGVVRLQMLQGDTAELALHLLSSCAFQTDELGAADHTWVRRR